MQCPWCHQHVDVPALSEQAAPAKAVTAVAGGGASPEPLSAPPQPIGQAAAASAKLSPSLAERLPTVKLGRLVPWMISLLLHAGLLVILAFFTMVVFTKSGPAEITIPDAELSDTPGGSINPGPQGNPLLPPQSLNPQVQEGWAQRDATLKISDYGARTEGEGSSEVSLYGIGGSGGGGGAVGGADAFGLNSGGGSGAGPRSGFMGVGGNAYHIVYVVDRSGSMLETLDEVKLEMLNSISKLNPQQTFHVIFFALGTPQENPPRKLVYASEEYKRQAAAYLRTIQPQGLTDPIPALQRAFEVLKQAPNDKHGKLIYLLTDGDFPDNERVLAEIRRLNADKSVSINTILHHHRDEQFMEVLKRIASENNGRFKFVAPEE